MNFYDVIIIGAGAAGLMCAIEAGKRGRTVLVIDHAKRPGEKIRISGGGRCNFTNLYASPEHFLSQNPRFCVSALKRFTQHDFIALVKKHHIAYHEKTLGQLFCDDSSQQIIDMLLAECQAAHVTIQLSTTVHAVSRNDHLFSIETNHGAITAASLVIATGGLSIPKMGATGFGYTIAKQFGLNIIPTHPGLVPFTLADNTLQTLKSLAGVSTEIQASCRKKSFREAMLFTHRGLSGPAILQISSYWRNGDSISINFSPDTPIVALLKEYKNTQPKQEIHTALSKLLPKRLAQYICEDAHCGGRLADISNKKLQDIADSIHSWQIIPNGTEGYRTAEVTLGGIDTKELSSKTLESKRIPNLYFIGEVVDVTGHLGGFNFQWAWASGYAAGQYT